VATRRTRRAGGRAGRRRGRRDLAVGALLAAVALAALPATAGAYRLYGRPWPQPTITYHVQARGYAAAVDRAARVWNRAGVGVRLRKATRYSADVIVRYGGRRCEGEALIGFAPREGSEVRLGAGCGTLLITLTAVHELGHVLGLGHERRHCARMNPVFDNDGTPGLCRRRSLAAWLARPLLADDIAGARRLYGR